MTCDHSIYPRLDILGAALGDGSRARLLCLMMDGRAYTTKELAFAADIAASTATAHLKKLEDLGLITSIKSGRYIYRAIASADVAELLETVAGLIPESPIARIRRRGLTQELKARCCYDHLAGALGVAMLERLVECGALRTRGAQVTCGAEFHLFLGKEGLGVPDNLTGKLCLDWSERRHHMSGPLARAILNALFERGWLARQKMGRGLVITPTGSDGFLHQFGIKRTTYEH